MFRKSIDRKRKNLNMSYKNSIGKIIFTTHTFYPNLDGVAVVNNYLARGLVDKGYNVHVITHKMENYDESYNDRGLKVYRVYEKNKEQEYVDFIKRIVGKDDVLINVCTQTPTTDCLLSELDKIQCRKKILYVHGIYHFGWEIMDMKNPYTFLKKVYHNLSWNQYYMKNKKYIKNYNVVTQLHEYDEGNIFFSKKLGIKTTIIENAVDDSFFERKDDSDFLRRYRIEKPYFICVANFDERKNQEMVLRAYYKCNTDGELVLIGRDHCGYINHLKQVELYLKENRKTANPIKKVRYYDNISREEIALFVRNAKMYLFGSRADMFPISISEAIAAGVPYVSTNVGVISHLPGGIVVNVDDVTAMASNIDKLNTSDDFRNDLSNEGKAYALKRMRISEKVKQIEKIICE